MLPKVSTSVFTRIRHQHGTRLTDVHSADSAHPLSLLKAASPSRSSSCRPYSRAAVSPRSSISACRALHFACSPSKIVGTNVSQRERSFRSITVGGRDAAGTRDGDRPTDRAAYRWRRGSISRAHRLDNRDNSVAASA